MSLWVCECHGLHGPMPTCGKASLAQITSGLQPISTTTPTYCASLLATEPDLAAARDKIRELNRRCQSAEAGLAEKVNATAGHSLGRALSNAAGVMYREQYRDLLATVRAYLAARDAFPPAAARWHTMPLAADIAIEAEGLRAAEGAALAALRRAAGEP